MKNLYLILISSLLMVTSCVTDDTNEKVIDEDFGVLPIYTEGSSSLYNLLDPDNSTVDFSVDFTASNAVVSSGELHVGLNGANFSKITDVSAFPSSYSATLTDVVSALGLSITDVFAGDLVTFQTHFTTTDGETITSAVYFEAPVLCPPPPGEYTIQMHDSFGDGWQTNGGNGGSGITVNIDGTIVEFGMCSPYEASAFDCTPWPSTVTDPTSQFTNATAYVTIPDGAVAAVWFFPGDQYGEISFEIYGPDGTLIFASGAAGDTGAGILTLDTGC